jgi:hypothetical protein
LPFRSARTTFTDAVSGTAGFQLVSATANEPTFTVTRTRRPFGGQIVLG